MVLLKSHMNDSDTLVKIDISDDKDSVINVNSQSDYPYYSNDGTMLIPITKPITIPVTHYDYEYVIKVFEGDNTIGDYNIAITNDFSYVPRDSINVNYSEVYYASLADKIIGNKTEELISHFYFKNPDDAKSFMFELNATSPLDVVLAAGGVATGVGDLIFGSVTCGVGGLALAIDGFVDIAMDLINEQKLLSLADNDEMIHIEVVTTMYVGIRKDTNIFVESWDGRTIDGISAKSKYEYSEGKFLVSENLSE